MNEDLLPWVSLVGERSGRVKELAAYRKPSGFSGGSFQPRGLGAEEVERAGNELFASIRAAMGYKRKDIAFSYDGAAGMLVCRDFDLALEIVFPADEPDAFRLRKTVSNLKSDAVFDTAFNELFGEVFQRLELRSTSPVRVEDWIDRVEDLDLEDEWRLQYPPDYEYCTLRLPGSEFEIKITPERLIMTRLLAAPPAEFWAGLNKLKPVLQPE